MSWFANVSDRIRIQIPEIDGWIECRKELTVGEQRGMFADAFKGQVLLADGSMRNEYDMRELSFGQVVAYLVDWSDKSDISDPNDRRDVIRALSADVYGHIEAAVQKHVESLEEQKKTKTKKKRPEPKASDETILQSVEG
jgi:hypothetical protein